MELPEVAKLVTSYLQKVFSCLGTKNTLKINELHSGKWWAASPDHWNFQAASKAVENVFGVKPDLTREGGSIPVVVTFQETLGKNIVLIPVGRGRALFCNADLGDDGAHSTNEKLDVSNYISGTSTFNGLILGTKLLGAYLHEVAAITV